MLYSTYFGDERAAQTDASGYLYRQVVEGIRRGRVTVAFAPEFGITHASYGGGVIVSSAVADLTEDFVFVRPDGTRVKGLTDPTDDLAYNSPPYMSDAVLSPNGRLLAYLEGPDTSPKSPDRPVGPWVAVVLDQKTERERLRAQVAPNEMCVTRLDFDGRWLVISRGKPGDDERGLRSCFPTEAEPLAIRVLDTRASRLELVELPNIVGVATIGGQLDTR